MNVLQVGGWSVQVINTSPFIASLRKHLQYGDEYSAVATLVEECGAANFVALAKNNGTFDKCDFADFKQAARIFRFKKAVYERIKNGETTKKEVTL